MMKGKEFFFDCRRWSLPIHALQSYFYQESLKKVPVFLESYFQRRIENCSQIIRDNDNTTQEIHNIRSMKFFDYYYFKSSLAGIFGPFFLPMYRNEKKFWLAASLLSGSVLGWSILTALKNQQKNKEKLVFYKKKKLSESAKITEAEEIKIFFENDDKKNEGNKKIKLEKFVFFLYRKKTKKVLAIKRMKKRLNV